METFTIVNGTTFIVQPLGGSPIAGQLIFAFDDILTFTPDQPLQADTTYEVILPEGGIKDAAGNGMEAYSFTFSTGSSVGGNSPPVVNTFTSSAHPAPPGQTVTLSATATDPEADPIEYRFDFGDGSPRTAWSAATSAPHVYAAAGHYQASVQVRDDSGSLATDILTVTVVTPPVGPLPTHSSPLVCDESGRRVWTVNPDNGTLTALHADTLVKVLEVAACADPRSLAISSQDEIWITCHDSDRLRVLDSNGSLVTEIPTGYGSAPHGIAFSPDGSNAFVSLQGSGRLKRYDATTRLETGSLDLGPTPRAVAVTGDGSRVLVTRFISPRNHAEVWGRRRRRHDPERHPRDPQVRW